MVYITRGKCSVYYASRVSVFFEKMLSVPKVTESSRIKLFYNYFFGTNGFVALGDFNQIHTI